MLKNWRKLLLVSAISSLIIPLAKADNDTVKNVPTKKPAEAVGARPHPLYLLVKGKQISDDTIQVHFTDRNTRFADHIRAVRFTDLNGNHHQAALLPKPVSEMLDHAKAHGATVPGYHIYKVVDEHGKATPLYIGMRANTAETPPWGKFTVQFKTPEDKQKTLQEIAHIQTQEVTLHPELTAQLEQKNPATMPVTDSVHPAASQFVEIPKSDESKLHGSMNRSYNDSAWGGAVA